MRRIALVMAAFMLAFTVSGCGKEAAPTNTAADFSCPTDNTKAFPKVRLAADLGIAFGVFHHWIWNPYQAGSFKKGADHRLWKLGKAGIAAAVVTHYIGNAADNVKADPTMCKVFGKPMAALADKVSNLKSIITSGNLGDLTSVAGAVTSMTGLLKQNGQSITESSDLNPTTQP